MKRIIPLLAIAAMTAGMLTSCNEKPKGYRFVIATNDGKEQVEKITALNDTDAVKQYLDRLQAVIVENIDKQDNPIKSMWIISPDGDTLNTNEGLLKAVMKAEQATMKPERRPIVIPAEPVNAPAVRK